MSRPFEGSYGGDGSKIADDTRLECGICWWVYDPALGDEDRQIAPGTAFRLLPDTWSCPNCAADKSKFMVIGSATPEANDTVQNAANAYRRAALAMKGMPIYNPTLAIEASDEPLDDLTPAEMASWPEPTPAEGLARPKT
mgnify:CR=1 FL=1